MRVIAPKVYVPVLVAAAVLAAAGVFGARHGGSPSQGSPVTGRGGVAAGTAGSLVTMTSPSAAGLGQANKLLPKLSPAQLAGQRVIYSYPGPNPPASLLRLISLGEVAGVIFFQENIGTSAHFRAVVSQLLEASRASTNPVHLPLLLMTDQEGGQPGAYPQYARGVTRLPGPPYQSARVIGMSAGAAAAARQAGHDAAANLLGYGLNLNLGPVLDVYRQQGDFIDAYGRSFSSDPAAVSALGAAYAKAEQALKVGATVKHFPGLGAAAVSQNTDEQPVTLSVPLTQLRQVDELPYRAAIAGNVKLVMVSWAVYPALDGSRPAGLSATIVGKELRKRLGFGGVTITDALEAGALNAYGAIGNRATLASQAGMDLILCGSKDVTEGDSARSALLTGYQHGNLNPAVFRNAVRRILALRATLAP